MAEHVLQAEGMSKTFGGVHAVQRVDIEIDEGEIVGLLGPNGAGKSTLFNLLSGAMKPDEGRLSLFGSDVTGLPAHAMCRRGVGRTFQIVRPLGGMTVLENAMVGAFAHGMSARRARTLAGEALERIGLAELRDRKASTLTLGGRKRLEVARAVATQPRLLLLDEMMAGLNPAELDGFIAVLKQLHAEGLTLIVVEHVVHAIMSLATRIVVLSNGTKIGDGDPHHIINSDDVVNAYLGERYAIT